MRKTLLVPLLVLFTASQIHLRAQNAETNISLQELLSRLEEEYGVRFSYVNEVITDKFVTDQEPVPSNLDEWLRLISLQTGLHLEQLSGHIIAISLPKPTEKIVFLNGVVLDANNEEPIPYAVVRLGTAVYMTNIDGSFFFKDIRITDSLSIEIYHIGYFSYRRSNLHLLEGQPLKISLKPKYATLSEVVIDNYFVPGISRVQGGGYQFTPGKQQILPGLTEPDLLFTLQTFPGISSANESVSNINIRGGTNDQNLVLWDGIRMFQTGHFFGLISAFNPYVTESATVIKNGTPANLGQGVSGTLNMKLKESLRSETQIGGGSNLLHANAQVGLPIGQNLSLELAARRSLTDLWQSPTYGSYFERVFQNTAINRALNNDSLIREKDKFLYYDWLAKINYHPNTKDKISLTTFQIGDDLSFAEEKTFGAGNSARESSLTQKSQGLGIAFTRFWNPEFKSLISANISEYHLDATNQYLLLDQQLDQSNLVRNYFISFQLSHIINSKLDWEGGYQLEEIGVRDQVSLNKPSFTSDIQQSQVIHVAHGQINWSNDSTGTLISAGFRTNYLSNNTSPKLLLEPRINAHQYLSNHLLIEVQGELKSQTVTQIIDLQNDFLGVEKRRWALANGKEYPLIRSKQLSFGLHYDLPEFFISTEVYIKQVDNIISTSQAFQNQLEPLQISGDYNTYGIDFMIKKSVGKLNSWLSYGWANTKYHFDHSSLTNQSFPSNLDIRHNIYLGNAVKTGNFEWSLGANYHSGVPVTLPNTTAPILNGLINYQSPNSARLPDYLRFDFSATYKWLFSKKHYSLIGLSIWNLTNRDNPLKTYYRRVSNVPVAVDQLALGFTPNASLQIQLYF